jgi:hypothetical protein
MRQASWKVLIVGISVLITFTTLEAKEGNFDAAPFGRPLLEKDAVSVEWPEIHRIIRLEVNFASGSAPLPSRENLRVEYWRNSWNGARIRRYGDQAAGSAGWNAKDDWYNGEWKTADTHAEFQGRSAAFTFAPSGQREYPELKVTGVVYRPTLKVRIRFTGAHPQVESLHAFTDSQWKSPAILRLQFENRDQCADPAEAYNASYAVAKPPEVKSGVCSVIAKVDWVQNPDDPETDRSVVTIRSSQNPFSFAVDEVERGDRIFIKDYGVLVTRADDPITLADHRHAIEESGARTLYDQVTDHAEQTLSGAWDAMPIKHPYYFILGFEGGRQRFRVDATGDFWMHHPSHPRGRSGKDNGALLWPDGMAYRFGLPGFPFAERHLADGYLPIVNTSWLSEDVLYEEEAFADSLAADLKTSLPLAADDPMVALVKFRFVNNSSETRRAHLTMSTEATSDDKPAKRFETLQAKDDKVVGSYQGREVLRYLLDLRGAGRLENSAQGVTYNLDLSPHQEHTIYVKLPFITLTDENEINHLRQIDPDRERAEVSRFWSERVAAGTTIRTPEPWLNDFYRSVPTHLLINDERELGSDRYMARVGSFHYGAYGNESIMMISDLDRRGYAKEAERTLELFLHYQGSVPLPGNFTNHQGVLYGAGGYEAGDYNQHHGWILWGLAEHYWYTRDRSWMEHAAPHLVDACQWIIEQRKTTQKLDAKGNRIPEYGLLPAGSLEDVTDFWPWLSTNSFTWWGMADAAAALKDFGHPAGDTLVKEAEAYRQDILRDYREAAVRAPVVRLRDGTYIPDFPTTPYTRGREYGWLRETLEGAIMLPITRLMDPNSREALWILKDYEDNRYISNRYGYSIPVFDQFWFSRGGFSMQPNLLHGPLPYFYRDDIKQFLRAYFNPFAAGFDHTLKMFCEHPLPELGYFAGEEFKTSDEAQSSYWLRLMFVAELDGALHLGRALPRYWLRDGETVAIRNAQTYFGPLTYEIRSKVKEGKIEMSLDPPTRNTPSGIVVRFRHPEDKPIRSVSVNGQAWQDFDPAKGDIRLAGNQEGHLEIVAEY